MTARTRTARTAEKLRAAGIKVGTVTEGDELQDGCIMLEKGWSVQVSEGDGLLGLVREVKGIFTFRPFFRSVPALLQDLRTVGVK